MKKTLIAITLATLPVAAMAEVVLYGEIQAGYEVTRGKWSAYDSKSPYQNGIVELGQDHNNRLSGSYLGFKGKEDLGNGLSAIWQVEQAITVTGEGKSRGFGTHDSFIGLEGGFGKIRAGYLSNYQNSDMQAPDAWEYNAVALGLGKYSRTGVRRAAIRYDSPDFGGFSFAGAYSPSDNINNSVDSRTTTRPNQSRDVYNLGLSYENSGFFGKYAYEYQKNARGTYNGQVHTLEAGYDANNLFVAGGYQYTRNAQQNTHNFSDSTGARSQEAVITAGYHFGNVFPKISYAHGWDVKAQDGSKISNSKYDQVLVGADYAFSKRTSAMVTASWVREGRGAYSAFSEGKYTTTGLGVGMKHKF